MKSKRFYYLIPAFIILPILASVIAVSIGRYPITFLEVIDSFIQAFGIDRGVSFTKYSFVINLRLPRVLLALLCGAGLSAAGAAVQAMFSNPLATPDTLGVSAGAGFGAALAILLGFSAIIIQSVAFLFGILAVAICYLLSLKRGRENIVMIILSGIVVASIFQALISLVQMMADPTEQLPAIVFWLMGDLSKASYDKLALCAPFILAGIVTIFVLRWKLNLLSLNENEAASLGLNVKMMRVIVIVAATLITAGCVSMCGIIGWVGMLVPHICRMIFGSNNKFVIPASLSLGATFLVIIDTIARSLTPGEIPISILTAIIGAPIFIVILRKTRGYSL